MINIWESTCLNCGAIAGLILITFWSNHTRAQTTTAPIANTNWDIATLRSAGYLPTPSGNYVHHSCIHTIDSGFHVDGDEMTVHS